MLVNEVYPIFALADHELHQGAEDAGRWSVPIREPPPLARKGISTLGLRAKAFGTGWRCQHSGERARKGRGTLQN